MKTAFAILSFFVISCFAGVSTDALSINGKSLNSNDIFTQNGFLDVEKIVENLKISKEFDFKSFGSNIINFVFKTDDIFSPKLFVKAVSLSILEFKSKIVRVNEYTKGDEILYALTLLKDGGFDMVEFCHKLENNGLFVKNFDRQDGEFIINLDAKNAKLNLFTPNFEDENFVQKSFSEYFIATNGAKFISINPKEKSSWLPLIYIYDKDLNLIQKFEKHEPAYDVELELDALSQYVLVTDNININNIKGGLILKLQR